MDCEDGEGRSTADARVAQPPHHGESCTRDFGQASLSPAELVVVPPPLPTQKCALDVFQSATHDLDNGRVRGRAILVSLEEFHT